MVLTAVIGILIVRTLCTAGLVEGEPRGRSTANEQAKSTDQRAESEDLHAADAVGLQDSNSFREH